MKEALIHFAEMLLRRKLNSNIWHGILGKYAILALPMFGCLFFLSIKDIGLTIPERLKSCIFLWIEILLVLFLLTGVCIIAASNDSIWSDEVVSMRYIRYSFMDYMKTAIFREAHPPLKDFFNRVWAYFFTDSRFSMKFLSIVPTVLAMIFGGYFLRTKFSDKSAVIYLLSLCASTTVLHQSVELRMYSWAFFFVTMTAISSYYCLENRRFRNWLIFIFFAECCAYTYYWAAFLAGLIYCFLLLYIVLYDRAQIKKVLFTAVCAIILYSPWAIVVFLSLKRVDNTIGWIPRPTLNSLFHFLKYPFYSGSWDFRNVFLFIFIITCIIFLIKYVKSIIFEKCPKKYFYSMTLISCPALLLVFMFTVSFFIKPIIIDRYLYPSHGLLYLFFAITVSSIPKRLSNMGCFLLLWISILSMGTKFNDEYMQNEEHEKFMAFWNSNINVEDTIIYDENISGHIPNVINYLFPQNKNIIRSYDQLSSMEEKSKNVWIIADRENNIVLDEYTKLIAELREDFYYFNIYYTDNIEALVSK
jgi:hypothetical protein